MANIEYPWHRMAHGVWLEPSSVRQRIPVDALGLHRVVEEDVGSCHDDVVDHAASSDQAGEPGQDVVRCAADLQESQARKDHDNEKAEEGDTGLRAVTKDFRGAAFNGQTVQTASRTVGVGVSGAED